MYFNIYRKVDNYIFFLRQLACIDISNDIELYDLKRQITKIEEDFQSYCESNKGEYQLLVTNRVVE